MQVLCFVTEASSYMTEGISGELVESGHISAYRLDNRHVLHDVGSGSTCRTRSPD